MRLRRAKRWSLPTALHRRKSRFMNSSPDTARATLSADIKAAAQELGFALAGISPVQLPPHGESFARWLRDGFAGELGYLSRTEALRCDPDELVPWASRLFPSA